MSVLTPPHFPAGERAIIGSCVIDHTVIPRVLSELTADDFYQEQHRVLFDAVRSLYRGEPLDFVTLMAWLTEKGKLEAVGGAEWLVTLIDGTPSAANVGHYIEIVKDRSSRRRIIATCNEALTSVRSDVEVPDVISSLQKSCLELLTEKEATGPQRFSRVNRESFNTLQEHITSGTKPGIKTGFSGLDEMTGGFRAGELIVTCARPSMGKTSFAVNVAMNVTKAGGLVLVYSLEMRSSELWGRIISRQSGIPFWYIRNASLNQHDMNRIVTAYGDLDEVSLWLDDSPVTRPSDVLMRTQRVSLELGRKASLIVIDYLQIMRPDEKAQTREREVSSMSAACKGIAKQLECPVMLLSQLNREPAKRKDPRPQLSDLRESGAIEQDADAVIGIFRKWPIEQIEANKRHAELGVLKQRNGPIGWDSSVEWDPNTVSFQDKAEIRNPPAYQEPREAAEHQSSMNVF